MEGNIKTGIRSLNKSSLMINGGYIVLKNFISVSLLKALQQESIRQFSFAARNESPAILPLPERGGQPSRSLYSAPGEHILQGFYNGTGIIHQLNAYTGLSLDPTGEQGSYSYYLQNGDFLSLHRDFLSCDVTLITTLFDQSSDTSKSGMLCLYPDRISESLNYILKTPLQGAKLLKLKQGDSLILLGGVVPHWVLPIQKDEKRVASLLCYRAAGLT